MGVLDLGLGSEDGMTYGHTFTLDELCVLHLSRFMYIL